MRIMLDTAALQRRIVAAKVMRDAPEAPVSCLAVAGALREEGVVRGLVARADYRTVNRDDATFALTQSHMSNREKSCVTRHFSTSC